MIEKIDHIGIAVKNLEEAARVYSGVLGLGSSGTEIIEGQGVMITKFTVGDVKLELLQPTDPDSPVGRFIEKRGEGVHHIAFAVDDIDESLETLKAQGVDLIDKEPRIGAGGSRIAFIHPSAAGGVLIELVETDA